MDNSSTVSQAVQQQQQKAQPVTGGAGSIFQRNLSFQGPRHHQRPNSIALKKNKKDDC